LLVAHDFIFKAVLINTAVDGNHHINQDHIFDSANHNTSLSLSNFCFVIFSAILADIIVSNIAIIATTNEVMNTAFTIPIMSVTQSIPSDGNGNWNSAKFNSGNLSVSSNIFGKYHLETINHTHIQIIVSVITDGKAGNLFLQTIRNNNQRPNVTRAAMFV